MPERWAVTVPREAQHTEAAARPVLPEPRSPVLSRLCLSAELDPRVLLLSTALSFWLQQRKIDD